MTLFRILILVSTTALTLPISKAAQPAVGDKASDFTLSNVNGKTLTLVQVVKDQSVVLVVLRGYPGYQCPFCNRQVQDFVENAEAFSTLGVRVIFIYPGPPQDLNGRANEFLANKAFPSSFDMLLDPGYSFTNLYGLRWDAPKETAFPSTFVIDRKGTFSFVRIVREHGGRVKAAEILNFLRN